MHNPRFGAMLGHVGFSSRYRLQQQIDDCWSIYRSYCGYHGRTRTLEQVFAKLIKAKVVRIERRRGKPPRVIAIMPPFRHMGPHL